MQVEDEITIVDSDNEISYEAIVTQDNSAKKSVRRVKKTIEEPKTLKTITLLEHQDVHVDKIEKMFALRPFALDLSMLGAGKTFTSTYLALKHRDQFKHVMIICPVSVEGKWKDMRDSYGLQLDVICS